MDARQFVIEIKQQNDLKEIPIIILTTASQSKNLEELKQLGAKGFLIKPNKYSELKKILQSVLV